jgi:glycosyltransferase involved in cell wall biosynthesis
VTPADRPRRVLWVIKGLGPGGAERLLVEHARASAPDGLEFEVAYVLDWKQHLVPELEALGVRTHALGVAREYDPRWVVALRSLLRRGDYDVVHAHSPLVASVARLLVRAMPRAHRPAFVYTEHNRWPSYRTVTRLANQATFGLDDVTFAVSEDVRESIPPRARRAVEVVVHGVDVEAVRAQLTARDTVRAELGVGPGESLAITVANLRHGKNYPGLIDAAERVVATGAPVRFAAAGQGPLDGEIRARLARSSLGDRFALLGYRTDATRLIAGADVFVLASHHEGLPVTVMEALTLGVPVVAPAVGGLREVVRDGGNGFLVVPGSPAALADAIVRASQPDVHARLAAGARATGDRFSSRDAVARIDARYLSVVGSGARARPT